MMEPTSKNPYEVGKKYYVNMIFDEYEEVKIATCMHSDEQDTIIDVSGMLHKVSTQNTKLIPVVKISAPRKRGFWSRLFCRGV